MKWGFPEIEGDRKAQSWLGRSTGASAADLFLPKVEIPSERRLNPSFFTPIFLVVSLVLFILIIRLANLQIINGEKNLAFSEGNRLRRERVKAQRGLIIDRDGRVLARNLPTFSIIYNPQFCSQEACSLERLKNLRSYTQAEKRWQENKESSSPFVLVSTLSRDEILSLGDLDSLAYLQVESGQLRSYPDGSLFSHLVGYLGEASLEELKSRRDLFLGDFLGKDGVERVYDQDLQGVSGFSLVEVDARENQKRFLSRQESTSGRSLVLTVSKSLQSVSDEALNEAEKKVDACCGAVIVADVRSGAILALVSHPSFDTNIFSQSDAVRFQQLLGNKNLPFFNRAIAGSYAAGSVFKLVVASAALSERVVNKNTLLEAPGSITIGDFNFGNWKPGGHGLINIESAIAQSADTFFYQIGGGYGGLKGLGPEKLASFARLFGFGQRSLIDLPEEDSGLVPDPTWKKRVKGEDWYLGNTYHLSIGQGDLLATPLQINQMTSAVANGGVLFRPFVLGKIVDDQEKVYYTATANVLRDKFIDAEVLKIVRQGMKEAAEPGGTAYPFFDFKIKVGAKTGTAEPGGDVNPHAWFTVFAPFDNPEVAVTVMVEHGGQGADVAAPVAKKILEEYFKGRLSGEAN